MSPNPIDGVLLDHVAHAVPRWQDVWDRYAVDLGAVWHSGGPGPGFAPAQLRFANDARIEVLMPWDTGVNDFLARFLAANGPGPHHLTFKVPDLRVALDAVADAGFSAVGVDMRHPEWMEAFLHPKEASGVVVQLAQAAEGLPPGDQPGDFPTAHRSRPEGDGPASPASLLRVVHVLGDLSVGRRVFVDLLGARVTGDTAEGGIRWLDLSWGGPLDVRLVGPDGAGAPGRAAGAGTLHTWVGGRQGRIHHLELAVDDPEHVPGAGPVGGDAPWWGPVGAAAHLAWVPPEVNLGLGLALVPRAAGGPAGK